MRQTQSSTSSNSSKAPDRATELRRAIRVDLVVYLLVIVIAILALAGLHPALGCDHAVLGTLASLTMGIITGTFAYLRYRANGGNGKREEPKGEEADE